MHQNGSPDSKAEFEMRSQVALPSGRLDMYVAYSTRKL